MDKPCMSRILGELIMTNCFWDIFDEKGIKCTAELHKIIESTYEENIPEPYKTDFLKMKKELSLEAIKAYEEDKRIDKELYKDGYCLPHAGGYSQVIKSNYREFNHWCNE